MLSLSYTNYFVEVKKEDEEAETKNTEIVLDDENVPKPLMHEGV